GSVEIFNIVFVVTLLSQLLQGMSLPAVARLLKLDDVDLEKAQTYGIEVPEEIGMLTDHVVTEEDLQLGRTLRELNLPHGIRVIMVRRGDEFLSPHGSMRLKTGDHLVFLLCEKTDE
ncbi:MAG: potassium/proton antiporter, partial [Bacteroidales bacterium]|nr:potassium/proton antiporter [Bacteroidales bacterium]